MNFFLFSRTNLNSSTLNVIHHRLQEQLQDDEDVPFDLKSLIPYVVRCVFVQKILEKLLQEKTKAIEEKESQEIIDLKAQRDQLLVINDQKNQQMLETMKIMRLILQDINMDIKPDVIRPDGRWAIQKVLASILNYLPDLSLAFCH